MLYFQEIINIGRDHADRFLVSLLLGSESAGIYVFFLQFANAASTLVNAAIVLSARSTLIAAAHRGRAAYDRAYGRLCRSALALMAALLVVMATSLSIFGHQLAPTQILASVSDGYWIFLAGWAHLALTLGSLGLYARHFDGTRILAILTAAAVLSPLAFVLLPAYGLAGMAWSNIIACGAGLAVIAARDRSTISAR